MTIEDKRRLNERKFPSWENLSNGGRKYRLEIMGKHGWKAWTKTIGNYKEK